MSRNKLIVIASMMLTIVIVTSWLGESRPPPGTQLEPDAIDPSPSSPALAIDNSGDNECPSMSDFMIRQPDATPDDIAGIEQCNREIALTTGLDQAGSEFRGNTRSKPDEALAHYEQIHGMGALTVFEDRIEALDITEKTIIPLLSITNVREDLDFPNAVLIEYSDEQGARMAYTFMLLRDDDPVEGEDSREVDQLIALINDLHR